MIKNTLLRLPDVIKASGLGRGEIYLRMKQGLFPSSIKIEDRAIAWSADEISTVNGAWISGKSIEEICKLIIELESNRKSVK